MLREKRGLPDHVKYLIKDRQRRLAEALDESATRKLPDNTRTELGKTICVGMILRSVYAEDIGDYLAGKNDLYTRNPFPTEHVRTEGDRHYMRTPTGVTFAYEVEPQTDGLVENNLVSIVLTKRLITQAHPIARLDKMTNPPGFTPVNRPFDITKLYHATITLAHPEAVLEPSNNSRQATPVQRIKDTTGTFDVYLTITPNKNAELYIQLPPKKIQRFNAEYH
ncbi:hypothetical protein HY489_03675 [Candidatus Woesearchaeota archaeon]|nr:hypothetical protein [Candidatus Woesearchaeota archaeon]